MAVSAEQHCLVNSHEVVIRLCASAYKLSVILIYRKWEQMMRQLADEKGGEEEEGRRRDGDEKRRREESGEGEEK